MQRREFIVIRAKWNKTALHKTFEDPFQTLLRVKASFCKDVSLIEVKPTISKAITTPSNFISEFFERCKTAESDLLLKFQIACSFNVYH